MEEKLSEEILDKLTKICICKGIPRSKIKEAIRNGAKNPEDVKKMTGAGSGSCGGKRCGPKILEMLKEFT